MTNSLSTIPINRLNSNELNEKINTSVEEKANIDLSNTSFANLKNVDGTLTWNGNALLNGSSLKTINNNSLVGSGNISITSSPISALCTTVATTTSTASNTKPAVVVQNYRNGNSWYRVWSDGWIEQGSKYFGAGNGTVITLVRGFRDTSYTLITCAGNNTNTNKHEGMANPYNRTTTNFKIWWTAATSNCIDWYACGY